VGRGRRLGAAAHETARCAPRARGARAAEAKLISLKYFKETENVTLKGGPEWNVLNEAI
jgi:hypothetical protein